MKKPYKRCAIVHIDGCDKTGKDTIRDLLVKSGKGSYLVIVRSFISQLAYNLIYKRNIINSIYFWEKFIISNVNNNEYFIHVVADKSVVADRFIKHNEKDMSINDYEKHQQCFNEVVNEARDRGINILEVDTTNSTPEQCVEKIIMHVETSLR